MTRLVLQLALFLLYQFTRRAARRLSLEREGKEKGKKKKGILYLLENFGSALIYI